MIAGERCCVDCEEGAKLFFGSIRASPSATVSGDVVAAPFASADGNVIGYDASRSSLEEAPFSSKRMQKAEPSTADADADVVNDLSVSVSADADVVDTLFVSIDAD